MSRSAGPGSPIHFLCPVERAERLDLAFLRRRGILDDTPSVHEITLTGRTKPYRPSRGSCIGSRSTFTSREYVCSCGRTGWSNHADLERKAGR